jgi:hypothetical protein
MKPPKIVFMSKVKKRIRRRCGLNAECLSKFKEFDFDGYFNTGISIQATVRAFFDYMDENHGMYNTREINDEEQNMKQ